MKDERGALLLYDGTCGFCASSVQWVLRHEGRSPRSLRFASLQSDAGQRVRAAHPELETVDSVIWYEPAREGMRDDLVLVRSRAVLRVLRYLGGGWRVLAGIGAIVPRAIRDLIYDFVARHRHRIIRRDPSCLVPTAEQRTRFLDLR